MRLDSIEQKAFVTGSDKMKHSRAITLVQSQGENGFSLASFQETLSPDNRL